MAICFPVRLCNRKRASKVWSVKRLNALWQQRCARGAYDCIFSASRMSSAFLIFPEHSSIILSATSGGRSNPTLRDIYSITLCIYTSVRLADRIIETQVTSSRLGAATRMSRHRLLIGAINRLVLLAQSIIRMFDMYFSMVRLRAAWASLDNESASFITTTISN
jgi:hypothetical protein